MYKSQTKYQKFLVKKKKNLRVDPESSSMKMATSKFLMILSELNSSLPAPEITWEAPIHPKHFQCRETSESTLINAVILERRMSQRLSEIASAILSRVKSWFKG